MPEPNPPAAGQLLIFRDGAMNLQVRVEGQTVWLPQRLMAELFQITVQTVNHHLGEIYDSGELDPAATIRSYRIVQSETGRRITRDIAHYNLEAILS